MSLIGYADLDRTVTFASGRIHHPFGGGAFVVEPSGCVVADDTDGTVDFQIDIVRALVDRDSRATLRLTLVPQYALQDALACVRALDPAATVAPLVLTNWIFRLTPTPGLRIPSELGEHVMLASNGLGTVRLVADLSVDSGLILEAMLRENTPLQGVALAQMQGVSPRVPVVVRFEASAVLRDLLARADRSGIILRDEIVAYFGRDPSMLPISISDAISGDACTRFAETMADRIVARFGSWASARAGDTGLAAQLAMQEGTTTLNWALVQAVPAYRQVALRIDLLSAAQAQAVRLGLGSVVHRDTLATLPTLGRVRVNALCTLPATRSGVEALGVSITFPPHLPDRPQARFATMTFTPPQDMASADVMLAPGEPTSYHYTSFAVISDEQGSREIDSAPLEGSGSPLRLSHNDFPIDFALVEARAALLELAVISGLVSYRSNGRAYSRSFKLDSGSASVAVAVTKERTELRIDAVATARDGSGALPLGPYESLQIQLDLTSFPNYGPRQVDVRCVFDDSVALRALSLLPLGADDSSITTLSFSRQESMRTFRWFATSPFHSGLRYRAYDSPAAAWSDAPDGGPLVVYSSQLGRQDTKREVVARIGDALRESAPIRLGRQNESAPANEASVEPIATSPAPDPNDGLLYTGISDPGRKLYVPRYILDLQTVSGQQRYRMAMSQGTTSSTLEVNLIATVSPAIADAARDAAEYPHAVRIRLEYLVAPPAGAMKALEFTDVTRIGANVKSILTFATLQERDDVYRALTEPERKARLSVQRFIDVSLPQPSAQPGTQPLAVLPLRPIAVLVAPVVRPVPIGILNPSPILATGGIGKIMVRKEAAPVAMLGTTAILVRPPILIATVPRPTPRFVPKLPPPTLAFGGIQTSRAATRLRLLIANWKDYPDDFFAPAEDLPPGGLRRVAARTWLDVNDADSKARLYNFCGLTSAQQLSELAFTLPLGTPIPRRVYVTLTDRRANLSQDSNVVATASPATDAVSYLPARRALEQDVEPTPFTFAPVLHGYIFQGLTPGGGQGGMIRYRLPWHGGFHTYLQDASRPSVVYCFPDKFKIARRRDAPFTPFITARVNSRPDGSDADVVLDYVVAPYTDRKRLDDARSQLLADARFGGTTVEFQPFASTDVRYAIDRPTRAGAIREQRSNAALVLQGALKDTLTMPLGDFQVLFDAMQRRTASMFMGSVEISVPHSDTEVILFEARLDELEGDIFTADAAAAQDGSFLVTLRNDIESSVDVQTLDVAFAIGTRRVRGLPRPGGIPCMGVAPGQSLTIAVAPEAALPAGSVELTLDTSGVTVVPDAEAIWNSILDRATMEYFRVVTVWATASLFLARPDRDTIAAIMVAFEGGGTVQLTAASLSAAARIDYPVDDVVLRRPVSDKYRYTVTVVHEQGDQVVDAQPREGSAQTFYVSVVA